MHIVVIGSGASGLTAIKTCKEGGLDVTCYECSNGIGGLWRYRDEDKEGLASVAKSTIINTSKEITSYSDFSPPPEFPSYMHNSMMFKYLQMYADKFELIPHILFNHRVEEVVPAEDYDSTGRWRIRVTDMVNGKEIEQVADGVMICTGHHFFPHIPTFPGQEKFKGTIIHTHSYKKPNLYEDKRVVVVGVGNSGGDAAVETSVISKKVYLSTRSGCWVMHRVGPNGKPVDEQLLTRLNDFLRSLIPFNISCLFVERMLNYNFDHELYQLKPKHRVLQQHPMINDTLPNRILSGLIKVKGNIKYFEENGVVFEGDDEVTEVDDVILATGYEIKFPFLSQDIISTENNKVNLYKFVFPPHMKHPTLCVIGLIQIVGGLFPISEMQSRWYVELMKKNIPFPTEKEMKLDILRTSYSLSKQYYASPRHTIQVDYISYLDTLASFIGAKPNLFKMFFTDPKLYWQLLIGPSLPYQYRLQGPHPWPSARDAILGYNERLAVPFKISGKSQLPAKSCMWQTIFSLLVFLVALLLPIFLIKLPFI